MQALQILAAKNYHGTMKLLSHDWRQDMSGGGGAGGALRRGEARLRCLRVIVRDTQRALSNVADVLAPGIAQLDPGTSASVQEIGSRTHRPPILLVLGSSCSCRARLVNCMLGEDLLPVSDEASQWRWIRIQYGNRKQVKLNLNNSEFELMEEFECQQSSWTLMPEKDLQRRDPTDLLTIMDIELPNPSLKDGLKIIIPPDLHKENVSLTPEQLKQTHEDFYIKRELILKQFTPIAFYALNHTGKNIFSEHQCHVTKSMSRDSIKNDDDFWKMHNMYYMTKGDEHKDDIRDEEINKDGVVFRHKDVDCNEPFVFSSENFLDLQQVKELYPSLQIYFVLFADSQPITSKVTKSDQSDSPEQPISEEDVNSVEKDVTESTENELPESDQELTEFNKETIVFQTQREHVLTPGKMDDNALIDDQNIFMQELIDQWRLVYCQQTKNDPKNYWMVLDDVAIRKSSPDKFENEKVQWQRTKSRGMLWNDGLTDGRLSKSRSSFMNHVARFTSEMIYNYLLELCIKLSEIHIKLLQRFILTSFDMAREMQVVPKKIDYVAVHEQQLYESIHQKFSEGDKKEELVAIMQQVLQEMKNEINTMDWSIDDLPCHRDSSLSVSNSMFYSCSQIADDSVCTESNEIEQAASFDDYNFEDYDIVTSDEMNSVQYQNNHNNYSESMSNDSRITFRRNDESSINSSAFARIVDFGSNRCNGSQVSIKQASLDVQKTVLTMLSRRISMKLVNFVDCLRDSYFGTLQRCLESLEEVCQEELGGRTATEAMRRVLSVAREVDLQACASFSVLRTLFEHLRRLFQRLRVGGSGIGGGACCVLSSVWRRDVALHTLHTLSATRLARLISAQILEKLAVAHEGYQAALASLSSALASRLHHTEDVKLAIRKKYAPGFARLCLESTSMCDVLQYGTPEIGREIGRGQYGVVYACKNPWAGHEPCAIKSVLPTDERHFNELAMEFFYTRSIPPHPRIVRLWGSVVERHSSGSPTVLLITERKKRDLHCAVRSGELSFCKRMRVALDIVEGIRYLHSLGLVHRDIKMKNVLLDVEDRGSLTDLGFCMPEALMSGSIVGTPVHMAPELLSGDYDSSVDVYAFGILFWYLCAGNIKLPTAFEIVQNKEQLWSKVRKGLRPERLPQFTDDCWRLMESCWASEPSKRALLGDVQPILEELLERSANRHETPAPVGSVDSFDLKTAWCQGDSLDFSRSAV